MAANRPRVRRTGALTRRSIGRAGASRPTEETTRGWRRHLLAPTTWLTGILLAVVTVTFQDVLTSTARTLLPFDRLPDAVSPQGAIDVVEVKNVKEGGLYLVRGGDDDDLADELASGHAWVERPDVVDVGEAQWMVTLQGRAEQQVRITDIVPEIEGGSCRAPLGGSLVYAPTQGAAEVIPLRVAIDDRVPRLKVYTEDGKESRPFFTGPGAKHITLKHNESEAFVLVATSEQRHCRWRYRIHYQLGGSTADMVLSRPGDEPFELTGSLPDARYPVVHYPRYICPGTPTAGQMWLTATGEEYARARSRGDEAPCPKGP